MHADEHSRRPGSEDFDFLIGRWNVHHRRLNKRLAHDDQWTEFGGTLLSQKILGGAGILDENLIEQPGNPYHAVAIRAFDQKSDQWSIW